MTHRFSVLIASSDPEHRKAFGSVLEQCGLDPVYATSVRSAVETLDRERMPLAFCEDDLSDGTFREVLAAARRAGRSVPVVIASRLGNTTEYVEAMSLGAFDFIAGPFRRAEVERIVHQALPRKLAVAH
jgi:DNA-binding NtrC family response regulator